MQYLQSHSKNPNIVPIVTNSGASGTMSDALYHSRICVRSTDASQYRNGESYSIDNIRGKRFAFVSNSSTSGFVFPSTGIVAFFSKKPAWSALAPNDLIEGGNDKLFSQVVFGGSHQGSAELGLGDVSVQPQIPNAPPAAFPDRMFNHFRRKSFSGKLPADAQFMDESGFVFFHGRPEQRVMPLQDHGSRRRAPGPRNEETVLSRRVAQEFFPMGFPDSMHHRATSCITSTARSTSPARISNPADFSMSGIFRRVFPKELPTNGP
jgi:hypothetical protein